MTKRLAIIDGKSVFYRGYYAMPNLSTKNGTPTGGVFGFAVMALEVIKRLKPDYVCVAWDKPKTNIRRRKELYPEYKANRKPPPPDFYAQIPLLQELLEAFGWPLYELDDYEADDIMGSFAVQAREQGIDTALITSDLDLLQVINGNVHVYALKKGLSNIELFHPESFKEKYGIEVDQFLDLKSIKGDSSDNIPGVPGIGEKGAVKLLHDHKSLDGIYENIDLISGSTHDKLVKGKDLAYLSKELARIWTDAPLKLNLKEVDGSKCDPRKVAEVLQKFEFRTLVRQLPEIMQIKPEEVGGTNQKAPLQPAKDIYISRDHNLDKLTGLKISEGAVVFLHSQTAGPHGRDPMLFTLYVQGGPVYSLDIASLGVETVVKKLKTLPLSKIKVVGYDLKTTFQLFIELGIELPRVEHDVLIGAFLLNSLRREQSLTELAQADLGYGGDGFENLSGAELIGSEPEIISIIEALYNQQVTDLKAIPELQKVAADIEWPLTPVLADMEHRGIALDSEYLHKFAEELRDQISDVEQQIYGHADQEFNISSPSQLSEILFVKLNLPTQGVKKGKTGAYSTAANELDRLRPLHPIIECITKYREMTKLMSTYVEALPKQVDSNGRLHTTYSLTVAQTGRLSSNDPNLQNIPVRTDLGNRIRTAFAASPGHALVSADYSQFELRLAAYLSGDKDLIDMFNRDVDVHVATAAQIYGREPEDVTKNMRRDAKVVNFGVMYGLSTHGLVQATGMTYEAAKQFIDKYFEMRPKLRSYIESLKKQASEEGYTETLFGRRRPAPDVHSSNFAVREAAMRAAINMPFQGTAADLMKLSMIKVQDYLKTRPDSYMLLQIHDSILLEVPEAEADEVAKDIKGIMEDVHKLPIKLTVDTSVGKNWGEL
jgi:DNA polymerase-1